MRLWEYFYRVGVHWKMRTLNEAIYYPCGTNLSWL